MDPQPPQAHVSLNAPALKQQPSFEVVLRRSPQALVGRDCIEQARVEQEQQYKRQRLEQERAAQQRFDQQRREQRAGQLRLEHERLEREQLEQEQLKRERLEQERLERERLEQLRSQQEQDEQRQIEQQLLDYDQLEQQQVQERESDQPAQDHAWMELRRLPQEDQIREYQLKLQKLSSHVDDDHVMDIDSEPTPRALSATLPAMSTSQTSTSPEPVMTVQETFESLPFPDGTDNDPPPMYQSPVKPSGDVMSSSSSPGATYRVPLPTFPPPPPPRATRL